MHLLIYLAFSFLLSSTFSHPTALQPSGPTTTHNPISTPPQEENTQSNLNRVIALLTLGPEHKQGGKSYNSLISLPTIPKKSPNEASGSKTFSLSSKTQRVQLDYLENQRNKLWKFPSRYQGQRPFQKPLQPLIPPTLKQPPVLSKPPPFPHTSASIPYLTNTGTIHMLSSLKQHIPVSFTVKLQHYKSGRQTSEVWEEGGCLVENLVSTVLDNFSDKILFPDPSEVLSDGTRLDGDDEIHLPEIVEAVKLEVEGRKHQASLSLKLTIDNMRVVEEEEGMENVVGAIVRLVGSSAKGLWDGVKKLDIKESGEWEYVLDSISLRGVFEEVKFIAKWTFCDI